MASFIFTRVVVAVDTIDTINSLLIIYNVLSLNSFHVLSIWHILFNYYVTVRYVFDLPIMDKTASYLLFPTIYYCRTRFCTQVSLTVSTLYCVLYACHTYIPHVHRKTTYNLVYLFLVVIFYCGKIHTLNDQKISF